MAKQKKRHKAPSRIKYEQEHPTIGFRASKELYDRLQAVKKSEGKSNADVLGIGVGLLEAKVREEKEIRHEAWSAGYKAARDLYQVNYSCVICGETMTVTSDSAKQAVRKYMKENGWGHRECHNRRR